MERTDSIFRAYDIRGVYKKTLDEDVMRRIGQAFSQQVEGGGAVVARDGRLSGESLSNAFIEGILSAGKDVEYLGVLPLGAGMFHAWKRGKTFAYITASHLSKEWNGLKFFNHSGIGFMEEGLERIRSSFKEGSPTHGQGRLDKPDRKEAIDAYIKHLHSRIKPERGLRIALDPGNGAAGVLVNELFSDAGFETKVISEEVDGNFPSRSPDPIEDSLEGLKKTLNGHDLGVAYDGDGDRVVVLDERGEPLSPEQLSYIMLSELLKEQKGPIVANVETTKTIDMIAERFKRKVHRVRVGHNFLMEGASRTGACFGVEPSGHYTVPSIFPFDDSLALSYYFACLLSRKKEPLSSLVKDIPVLPFERVNLDVPDERKFMIIERLKEQLKGRYPGTNTMDGVRVDLKSGWVLIRPSNTQPMIRLTVEARTREDLEGLKKEFMGLLGKYINP